MTEAQWEAIERTLAGLTADDRRAVADRILASIPVESPDADRARRQREALDQLCRAMDALPAVEHGDGMTNRDHDRILYTR